MNTPTSPRNEDTLFCELQEVLEGNGNVPPAVKDRLVLKLLGATYQATRGMDKRLFKVESYLPMLEFMKWAGAILGISMLALIWALITGQATVTFGP